MLNTVPDAVSCAEFKAALKLGRTLTAQKTAHAVRCDDCREAWLDATVVLALEGKPEIQVPADFAARVSQRLPAKRAATRRAGWGLMTAILLVATGLAAMAFAKPVAVNTWIGIAFMALVVSEIAGIALWLGGRSSPIS
ncbi:MAG: hypothetical protein ACRD3F_09715 [Acidobacteriaceae bacterium]